ncbi:MAG: porin [Verrucomicrobiales bacterium]|nr:porin [Verrucomicrobiales bacterium]
MRSLISPPVHPDVLLPIARRVTGFRLAGFSAVLALLVIGAPGAASAQTFVHTDSDDRDWNDAANWSPATVPNTQDAAVIITRDSGGGNRVIDGDGDTFTLGSLNWTNDDNSHERLDDTELNFNSASTFSTLTYTGTDGGNLQFREGTNLIVANGQTLNINNASSDDGSRIVLSSEGSNGELVGAGTVIFNDTSADAADNMRTIRFEAESNNFEGIFRLESGRLEIEEDGDLLGDGVLDIRGGRIETDDSREISDEVDINGSFTFSGDEELTLSGPVTLGSGNHNIIVDNTDEDFIFSGAVGGAGFTKSGDGTLVITNATNTFNGPVKITEGELEFQDAGALGNTPSLTADGGRLSFRGDFTVAPSHRIFIGNGAGTSISTPGGSSDVVYNGVIANKPGEVGSWAKQGSGRLILGGANTFTGSVAVNNGELRLNDIASLTTASSVLVDDATLELNVGGTQSWQIGQGDIILNDGGKLEQLRDTDNDIAIIDQAIRLTGSGGEINASGDSQITVTGNISGTNLEKSGGGELRFSDTEKTYSGETLVSNGRLRIDEEGMPTNTSAVVLDDGGNLRFGQAKPRTFSIGAGGNAPITITGNSETSSIEYTDSGSATLTNNIAINTTGSGGGNFRSRDAGSTLELTGNLTGAGDLFINEGTGGNPVQGGTVYLRGNASSFTGDVDVLQSILRLGENTTLGAGDFTLRSPSTLSVDINSPTTLGSVSASNATLASGSTITPNFNGTVNPGENTFTLIDTTGALVNNGAIVLDRPLVDLSLVTTSNQLQLRAFADFGGAGLGLNRIQSAVGDYLQTTSGGNAVGKVRGAAANLLDATSVAEFYDAVAPDEIGGIMDGAIFHGKDQLRSVNRFAPHVQQQLNKKNESGSLFSVETPTSFVEPEDGWTLFHDVRAQRGSREREFELGGYEQNGQAFLMGADRQFSDSFAGTIFGSYENTRTEFDRSRGWGSSDTVGIGAMGSILLPQGHISAGIQHLHHSFSTERYSSLGTARAKPDGDQLGLILQSATRLGNGPLSITPTAHLQYNKLWIDSFTENGSAIAQSFDDLATDSLEGGLGLRVGYTIPTPTMTLRPEVFAEYRQEFLDGSREISSSLIGATTDLKFSTPERSDGYAVVGGGLHADFSDNTSAFVQYEAQLIDTDASTYGVYGGLRWNFSENPLAESMTAFADSTANYRDTLRGSYLGDAIDAINLRARVDLQYDHAETDARAGTDPDPNDPADTDFWFARRVRLYADRDFGLGFYSDVSFDFGEDINSEETAARLFQTNVGWNLFEPFELRFGLDRVPLGYEDTTSSASLKTIERSAASRVFGRLGGDQIGRDHWSGAVKGRLRELYASNRGLIRRYDFHYEFAVANPREDVDALWDDAGTGTTWGESSYYLRVMNELHTSIGQFDFGVDLADIPTFRARSDDEVTGAKAYSPFINYQLGWFNLSSVGYFVDYDRDAANGGTSVEAEGIAIIPSLYITPKVELVGMYSNFETDGDFAIRANQASRNIPTTYSENRRYDRLDQFYFGVNHYLNGNDLKIMYGVEKSIFDETRADRPVGKEESWAFRTRVQLRF